MVALTARTVLTGGLVLAAAALFVAACSGGGGATGNGGEAAFRVTPVSGPPVVGKSRFAFAILSADNRFTAVERVQVRFFRIAQDGAGTLAGEAAATERRFENFFPHLHKDGVTHPHTETSIFYTVDGFDFDKAGLWGMQAVATLRGGREIKAQMNAFPVADNPPWPTAGRPVPATHNQTLREVRDISEIDTSSPPRPFMHLIAIDEALAQRKPFVVTFSTPAFCRSAVCGPVTDVVASFYDKYQDRLVFIHVEPYVMAEVQKGNYALAPIVERWGIPSEPWTYVVGADGRVVADFGGLFAPEELEAAIQKALLGS